jgi:hyperosmotically inducible periplasmic protein
MRIVILLGLALAIAGCDRNDENPASQAQSVSVDNTKKNERDRSAAALTPVDQGNDGIDLDITQKIRQEVIKDDSLSMRAKNVKIITVGGVVTLRGPVESDAERASIGSLATGVPGVKRVDNQLEGAAN